MVLRRQRVRELVQDEGGCMAEHALLLAPEPEGDQVLMLEGGGELLEAEDAPADPVHTRGSGIKV